MAWILTALSGALLGVISCLLLLLLLRYPRTPFIIGTFRWQGILHFWFTHKFQFYISSLILSMRPQEKIRQLLISDSTRDQAEAWIGKQVDAYMTNTLPEKWPMLSLLIGEKTQDKVRMALTEHIRSSWHPTIESICKDQLTNEQIRDKIILISQSDQPDHWAKRTWQSIDAKKWHLLLISLLTGTILALIGQLLYLILQSL